MVKVFETRLPIGSYKSKENAAIAADDLNRQDRKACHFYVQEVPSNSFDLKIAQL